MINNEKFPSELLIGGTVTEICLRQKKSTLTVTAEVNGTFNVYPVTIKGAAINKVRQILPGDYVKLKANFFTNPEINGKFNFILEVDEPEQILEHVIEEEKE